MEASVLGQPHPHCTAEEEYHQKKLSALIDMGPTLLLLST